MLTLFADATDASTWMAVAFAGVSAVGTMGAAAFAYLTSRDKLRYDAKVVAQDAKIAAQGETITTLTARVEECDKERHQLKSRLDYHEAGMGERKRQVAANAADIETLKQAVARDPDARTRSGGSGDGDDGTTQRTPPLPPDGADPETHHPRWRP